MNVTEQLLQNMDRIQTDTCNQDISFRRIRINLQSETDIKMQNYFYNNQPIKVQSKRNIQINFHLLHFQKLTEISGIVLIYKLQKLQKTKYDKFIILDLYFNNQLD
ncbi:unnamed protein product [Paramecium sonneborni]|uniref:Uncharacterized protein n=1 Tax=Paramecium sonneborni TaxID=65129 RepID=A0A8S1MXD8_9CILI|nr:unnamed protein product [Paramecium sonneborni]